MKNKRTPQCAVQYKRLITFSVATWLLLIQPMALNAVNNHALLLDSTEQNQQRGETKPIDNTSATIPAAYKKGMPALFAFISENIVYPKSLIKQNIQGAVIVRFVVDTQGKVSDAWTIKSVHPEMDKEAVRVVKKLGKFSPAKLKGEKIPVYFTLPIRFRISK